MPTACVNQPRCKIHLKSERLEVFGLNEQSQREEVLREIPLRDLERLIVEESVQITSAAVAELLRANVPISFLGWNGQFLGGFLPALNQHGLARLRQYQRTLEPAFTLQMAGRIISAKLYNQRRVLQRLAASRPEVGPASPPAGSSVGPASPPAGSSVGPASPPAGSSVGPASPPAGSSGPAAGAPSALPPPHSALSSTLSWLDALFGSLQRSQSVDELRGYEGAAAARYFQAWASFLPAEFPFERRSTRPPLNAVNACISFGATLVYTEAAAFVHAHGLDPALGLLHATEDGRWSLALDLMEPFRPVLIEALALDLFSHQILASKHFEPKHGGIYLNVEGRKKFILQYERRMERQFLSEAAGHRTTLRQQLEHQAVMYKAALEQPEKFEPFLMN